MLPGLVLTITTTSGVRAGSRSQSRTFLRSVGEIDGRLTFFAQPEPFPLFLEDLDGNAVPSAVDGVNTAQRFRRSRAVVPRSFGNVYLCSLCSSDAIFVGMPGGVRIPLAPR